MKLIIDHVLVSSIKSFSYDSEKDVLDVTSVGEIVIPEPEEPKPVDPGPVSQVPYPKGKLIEQDPLVHKGKTTEIEIASDRVYSAEFVMNGAAYGGIQFDIDGTPGGARGITCWFSLVEGGAPFQDGAIVRKKTGPVFSVLWNTERNKSGKIRLNPNVKYFFNVAYDRNEDVVTKGRRFAQ